MSKALTSTILRIFDPFLSWAATRYQANVAVELRKYGLRYEDLWDPLLNQVLSRSNTANASVSTDYVESRWALMCVADHARLRSNPAWEEQQDLKAWLSQDVDEALKRLPQAEVDARNQRLKRAMDLSLKHAYLPKDLQSVQTPYSVYISVSTLTCSCFMLKQWRHAPIAGLCPQHRCCVVWWYSPPWSKWSWRMQRRRSWAQARCMTGSCPRRRPCPPQHSDRHNWQ